MWMETTHWRVINILARVFGLMALVAAVGSVGWAVYFAIHPEAANNVQAAGLPANLLYGVVGIIIGAIAAFFLRRRPYRPDHGDAAFSDQSLRWIHGLPSNWSQSAPQRAETLRRRLVDRRDPESRLGLTHDARPNPNWTRRRIRYGRRGSVLVIRPSRHRCLAS